MMITSVVILDVWLNCFGEPLDQEQGTNQLAIFPLSRYPEQREAIS
jgi:hypothetical protein